MVGVERRRRYYFDNNVGLVVVNVTFFYIITIIRFSNWPLLTTNDE